MYINEIENHKKIALFCAGLHGILFYHILKICGIGVDCFIDNSEDKWGKVIVDDIKCVAPNVLEEENYIVYVCVGRTHYKIITEEIISKFRVTVKTITEFFDVLVKKDKELYFKILKKYGDFQSADLIYDIDANKSFVFKNDNLVSFSKVAVYTAVFGNYDSFHYSQCSAENVDMIFISDVKPKDLPSYYKWMDAKCIIPNNITSPIKRNRYVKMNPHKFLSMYDYSIYIDGNIEINNVINQFIQKSRSGISVYMHPARECIFHEAMSIVNFNRVNADDVCHQMKRYMEEGMPSHYGLGEMPIIAREHNKAECISVMEIWWEEFDNESQRDQLSFMYALWKNGLVVTDLGCLGYDVRNDKNITFFEHINENRNIKNEKII